MTVTEEWQLVRLRYALRIYHRFHKKQEAAARKAGYGDHVTVGWQTVWDDIADHAEERGVTLPYSRKNGIDRLRKFVEGEEVRKGNPRQKYPTPKPVLLEAIFDFLTDENNDETYLSPKDIEQFETDFHAPARLVSYLRQISGPVKAIDTHTLEGSYRCHRIVDGFLEDRTLIIYDSADDGLLRVREWQDRYVDLQPEDLESGAEDTIDEAVKVHFEYDGWAILTPELNLIFFLKDVRSETNRYYFSFYSDIADREDGAIGTMVLLNHHAPFEPVDSDGHSADQAIALMVQEIPELLFQFARDSKPEN